MPTLHPYFNFDGKAEEAFLFYESVFGTKIAMISRMNEAPGLDDLPENERNRVMHVSMPINDKTILMASDILPSKGHKYVEGTNINISITPESREQADEYFNKFAAKGTVDMPMADAFWGDYFGMVTDEFGIKWLISYNKHSPQ